MASIHSQLILTVLKLNLFSQLETPIAVDALAQKQNWNIANTEYMLNTLYSMGYIEKRNFSYQNTQKTSRYLVKGKQEYIGGSILLFGNNPDFTNIDILTLLEKKPQPTETEKNKNFLSFQQYTDDIREAQKGFRQQKILSIVTALPEYPFIHKILDLGCNRLNGNFHYSV